MKIFPSTVSFQHILLPKLLPYPSCEQSTPTLLAIHSTFPSSKSLQTPLYQSLGPHRPVILQDRIVLLPSTYCLALWDFSAIPARLLVAVNKTIRSSLVMAADKVPAFSSTLLVFVLWCWFKRLILRFCKIWKKSSAGTYSLTALASRPLIVSLSGIGKYTGLITCICSVFW